MGYLREVVNSVEGIAADMVAAWILLSRAQLITEQRIHAMNQLASYGNTLTTLFLESVSVNVSKLNCAMFEWAMMARTSKDRRRF